MVGRLLVVLKIIRKKSFASLSSGRSHPMYMVRTELFRLGAVSNNKYLWMDELIELSYNSENYTLAIKGPLTSPQRCLLACEARLEAHPDHEFRKYILRGIREGFRVGFRKSGHLKSAKANL